VQARLGDANPGWLAHVAPQAPDGDADLPADLVSTFKVVACLGCGGVLKPDVVFFGGHVRADTLAAANELLDEAEALLVIGSSLAVFSGFRFVRRAAERGVPVAIVNLGPTRGDELARVRVEARAGDVLPRLLTRLGG
jgi:NAD-dependent SIR2 family protein deacetylase